ncbi:MAG: hypothetical protein KatS3mg057_0127 [Herpetosiphonaceae bacterium]|nr:MAG: hypothetical protein KatS3mg057_0127 [Herpetosiphonaceae bacterium]
MITIFIITFLAGMGAVLQRGRVLTLARHISPWALPCSLFGTTAQTLGMSIGGGTGHLLITLSAAALTSAAYALRRWPGGPLLVAGVALNALAMTAYGRMPIAPEVLMRLGHSLPDGTVLSGSKDIVADGWLAYWLGDRFILALRPVSHVTIFSFGDLLMIAGLLWMAIAPLGTSYKIQPAEEE